MKLIELLQQLKDDPNQVPSTITINDQYYELRRAYDNIEYINPTNKEPLKFNVGNLDMDIEVVDKNDKPWKLKKGEKYYYIDSECDVEVEYWHDWSWNYKNYKIGNCFRTKEEAEQVVKKLKAWKRLKDAGFKFELWDYDGNNYQERINTGKILFRIADDKKVDKDLDLLFSRGGGDD